MQGLSAGAHACDARCRKMITGDEETLSHRFACQCTNMLCRIQSSSRVSCQFVLLMTGMCHAQSLISNGARSVGLGFMDRDVSTAAASATSKMSAIVSCAVSTHWLQQVGGSREQRVPVRVGCCLHQGSSSPSTSQERHAPTLARQRGRRCWRAAPPSWQARSSKRKN